MSTTMPKDNEVDEKVEDFFDRLYGMTFRLFLDQNSEEDEGNTVELRLAATVDNLALFEMQDHAVLYSAATVAELRARADALAEELRHANKGCVHELNRATALEADAARYRFLRRKLCVTGNGDGTCAMQAINLPHRIHGWPEHGEHEQFFDAAIDSYLTGADPT